MRRKIMQYMKSVCLCIVTMLALPGCMSPSLTTTTAEREYDSLVAEAEAATVVVPDDVSAALLKGSQASRQRQIPVAASRFDVAVSNVPAKIFFVSLVADAGVNVVAHPEIEGVVSLELKNVTVEEVLSAVRDVYGYEYKFKSGIYTIYPRKLRTEIFPINYLDVQRVGVTDTSVLIGKISSQSGGSGSNSAGSNNSSGSSEDTSNLFGYLGDSGGSEKGEGISPGARVQTLNKTDFWGRLHQTLLGIIGGENDGRFVVTNTQAGLVVARALPAELATIREFLDLSDLSVQRQVVLETKILEVQLNDRYESGINWSVISGALSLDTTTSGIGSINSVINDGQGVTDVLFSSALKITDITKLIGLLDRQGDVSVLSSPRISTVNNQKAVIRVGSDEFFVTGISSSTTASAAAVTSAPNIELSSFFSGISLDVTPQISEDGGVILHVHPIVTSVQDQLKEIQVGDQIFSLPLALREIRESDSIVKAVSGQVVVLGGLMQETSSGVETKRSKLGNIPILNIFFKHEEKSLRKTELVILMKPIVIDEKGWQSELERSRRVFSGRDSEE